MKFLVIFLITLMPFAALSKDVKDFNKVLIENVQKDIQKNNDEEFKAKQEIKRAPASVDEKVEGPTPKTEKINQVSLPKW